MTNERKILQRMYDEAIDMIERKVERKVDALDRRFIHGEQMSQQEYDAEMKAINRWADDQIKGLGAF